MKKSVMIAIVILFYFVLALGINSNYQASKGVSPDTGGEGYGLIQYEGPAALDFDLKAIQRSVSDPFQYYGISTYLGKTLPVYFDENGRVKKIKLHKTDATIFKTGWVGYRGRFESILINTEGQEISVNRDGVVIRWTDSSPHKLNVLRGRQDGDSDKFTSVPDITRLQYIHLPRWMRMICRGVESLYKALVALPLVGWGGGLFLFALIIKNLMVPISSMTAKSQNDVTEHRAALEPLHSEIKVNLKGEEAHIALMKTYKDRGITPYYTLKPMAITLIGIPILIAIFNMLGEVHALKTASFLWIDSLAYPDTLATLPFRLPFFGDRFNLLPFLMSGVTVVSTILLRSDVATARDMKRRKQNLYLMTAAFFLLFYNFPSGMILYWTLATFFATIVTFIKAQKTHSV